MVIRKNAFYYDKEGNIDAEAWLSHIAVQRPESRLRLIRNAAALSQLASNQKQTPLGLDCAKQGFVMADVLLDLMLDEDTICAALLYNAVCYAELDLRIVEEQLNSNVTKLLKGSLRMNNISHFLEPKKLKSDQLEKFRKMLFSMADDMRVVLLKLAERIAWMRAIKKSNRRSPVVRAYIQETLTVYASLANRLGIHAMRYELEDLAMERLAPRLYRRIADLLQERLIDRESYIKEVVLAIEIMLPEIGIQGAKIISRIKNFYGTYRKMCSKRVALHQVYDLNAIRIIVNTVQECYQVLEAIQTLWTPVEDEFDDYVKFPKENGYRSIHSAVYGMNNKIIEIQIRTFEMDQESEHGLSAHWEYKEEVSHKPDYQMKIAWLRQVLTWQKELVKNGMHLIPELTNTLDDRVYVLKKEGDIVDLPKGATVLDFAYHVNAELGHYCQQAFVNGHPQHLTYVLHTGEQVAVITGKQLNVNWDWLNPDLGYLNTVQAKAKVLHWFQQKEYYQHIVTGQLLLEKGCRQLGISFVDQSKLAQDLAFQSKKELLAALGSGELGIIQALRALYPYSQSSHYYTALEKPKAVLSVKETQAGYPHAASSAVEVRIIAASNTDILDEVMLLLKAQYIKLSAIAATYYEAKEHTHITLHLSAAYAKRAKHLVNYLRAIEKILTVEILYEAEKVL